MPEISVLSIVYECVMSMSIRYTSYCIRAVRKAFEVAISRSSVAQGMQYVAPKMSKTGLFWNLIVVSVRTNFVMSVTVECDDGVLWISVMLAKNIKKALINNFLVIVFLWL